MNINFGAWVIMKSIFAFIATAWGGPEHGNIIVGHFRFPAKIRTAQINLDSFVPDS